MADDAAADAPRDAVSGVAALLTLPAGTVVCFLDAAGPLATVKVDKSKWVLRPAAELTAVRGPGPTAPLLPALAADSLFMMQRAGDKIAFRSLGAEGRTLQVASSSGEHALVNWNFGPWESWTPDEEHGLVNTHWGTPLGLGLAVVHASLAVDVREASRRAARDLRQLRSALQTEKTRSTEMERQVALADAAARAEAGKGWAALQAKLTSTDSARAAAARALAEQAASLEAAERARSRAEAAAAQAASSAASHAARAQSAAAKLADSERRHAVALRAMEDQLKAKEAALAAAEADRTQLVAALRDAVHAAKRAARAEAKEAKQAPLAPREEGAAVAAAEPTEVAHALSNDAALPAPVAPAAPPAQLVSIPEAEASPEMTVVPSKPAPPSARKAFAAPAPEERTTQWPGPPPRPIWSASPATLPLARYESKHVVKPAVLPAPARTPPRAEALVTVAEAAAATSSSGMESSDSSQFDAGAENVICRTLGSARKRLNMSTLAVLGAPEDGHDIVREMASVTRPAAREERHREERRRDRSEPMPAPAAKLAPVAAAADIDKPVDQRSRHQRRGTTRSAREPERPARQDCVTSAAQPAHAKPAAKHHHHGGSRAPPAAALPSSKHALEALPDVGGLSPPPRAPLGRRSVNEMFLGLWEPSLGGATPSVPRRAAMQAQPRLAGWRLAGDAAEEFEE